MKRLFIVLFVFTIVKTQAQVDRTQMPEPGPAPEINLKDAQRFELDNGLKVLVVENHKLPRVSAQLTIDNNPIAEGDKAGVASLLSSLLGNGSKNISKDEFNEEIDFLGARLSFGSQSAFASSLSKYFPRVLELMADAAINPNFTEEEFEKEKTKIITGLKSEEKDVKAISSRVQRALAYGAKHPYGEFTTEETVNNVKLADVRNFYDSYFAPTNAYLIIIGDINFEEAKELVEKNFKPWTKRTVPSFGYSTPKDVQYTQINFVDVPNAVQSEITVENLVNLKMSDPDYLAALVANQILGGGGEARLFLNLREDKGYTYGSYSSIGNDKYAPSRFRAFASVRNAVTDSSVVEILNEIDKITSKPVTEEELKNTKAKYIGNFVLALERPETIAQYALNIETENLQKDFYKTYLEKINAITVEDVQKAAQKYFSSKNARIVVVGKGSEVLENLEKTKFNGKELSIFYYDKYANKVDKPDYSAETPTDVTAAQVLENYFKAIGGKDKLKDVSSVYMLAEAAFNGATLGLVSKVTTKNQSLIEVSFGGMTAQKIVFDGTQGYVMAQGQRMDYDEKQIEAAKAEAHPFAELKVENPTLEKVEPYEGGKAYAVKLSDKKTAYFDTESGLKVKETTVQEQQGQKITVTTNYSDYQEVKGIKFPFTITQALGPQNIDFKVKEIKINEGVSDEDFK
ncbi:M16 family metallopeptidase [Aquimarina brevivitae]|uniref:Putative Zn-dependent peptidase n=1 Tax=Aquimarina brevivitae TaxID=323412 RepID=A0A4Q7PGS8_9FLAO|nr:pitrilysin family protein [Aquimarina brevivitae]RZS99585.1 putative Zn-dependent peptidase [Aquimarina brevivitae]